MRRRVAVLTATTALVLSAGAIPAAALVAPPEGYGAVIDLGPLGEVGDVTTVGQATGLGTGQPDADDPTREYVLGAALPVDPVLPESIAYDPLTRSFFTASALNGAIYKGGLGTDVATQFVAPLGNGVLMRLGIEVHGNRLYVVSGPQGTVDVFDTRTAAPLGSFNTGLGGLLNDLVVDAAGDLYVTDSVRPVLFRIRAASLAAGAGPVEAIALPTIPFDVTPRVNGVFNLNGIVTTGAGAFVLGKTNTDQLYRVVVDRSRPTARLVAPIDVMGEMTAPDGMELVGGRLFVVNNLTNRVVEVDLSADRLSGRVVGRTGDPTFSTATGIASTGDRLLVSNSQLFTVPMVVPATVSSIRIPAAVAARPVPTASPSVAAPSPAATPRRQAAPTATVDAQGPGALAATGSSGSTTLGLVALVVAGAALRSRRRSA